MRILIVDSSAEEAEKLAKIVRTAFPNALIDVEGEEEEACYLVERKEYSAVLTETKRKNFNGLRFARSVHERSPQTRVIFVTNDPSFAVPAFKTRAVGYLVTPISKEDLREEFVDLGLFGGENHKVEAKTFGNFEMFCDGEIIQFGRAKSKELLAYLIDKNGTTATGSELIVNLWEDKDVDRTTRSMLHNLVTDIKKTLLSYGISEIFETKRNAFRIKKETIVCEYFDLLDGKEDAARKFKGEYMSAYAWAEFTIGRLENLVENALW
ncbi:MAG: response regulator [Clostridia bacterium]|nr:response regulator [Clostridia bacterium]